MPRAIEFLASEQVEDAAIRLIGERANPITAGPEVARGRPRGVAFGRIDAAGEQLLEPLVNSRAAEGFLDEGIEAERGQVAFVEHDRVPKLERLAVIGVAGQ